EADAALIVALVRRLAAVAADLESNEMLAEAAAAATPGRWRLARFFLAALPGRAAVRRFACVVGAALLIRNAPQRIAHRLARAIPFFVLAVAGVLHRHRAGLLFGV